MVGANDLDDLDLTTESLQPGMLGCTLRKDRIGGVNFDALDSINGGADYDTLELSGDYSAGVVFGANTRQIRLRE